MRHKLRLGLLIGDWEIPAWQYDLLSEILKSEYASIDLVIQTYANNCKANRRGLAVSIYSALWKHDKAPPTALDPCEIVDSRELLHEIKRTAFRIGPEIRPAQSHASGIASIESEKLDVILALDDISLIDSLIGASRFGVWFYDYSYDTSTSVNTSEVGLQEVLRRDPYLYSALMIRSRASEDDQTAFSSYSSVNPRSHTVTRNKHLWKIRTFVPRALRELYNQGEKNFFQKFQSKTHNSEPIPSQSTARMNVVIALVQVVAYAFWRLKLKISRKFFNQKWILMFRLGGNSREFQSFVKMRPPEDWFWADPFVVRRNGSYYVFFEEASVKTGHGHLSVMRIDNSGRCSEPQRILERPYHLSYPFILDWRGSLYLIPESADNRTIEVYKCKNFPQDWEFECYLMENVSAYDATLFEHNGTWWLFANIRENEGASGRDELCLFSSDQPLGGDWRPHPMNPIISDVRRARPAGKILRHNGRIIRPSQNSSYRYGFALNFCEILELTKTSYKERLIECIEPGWDPSIKALHTYNECGDLTVIDAVHRTRRSNR